MFAFLGITAGAFGFDQSEGFAVVAPKDVINEAIAGGVGHSLDGELPIAGLVECPACFFEQHVDVEVAGCAFVVVVGVGLSGIDELRLGDLLAELLVFSV